jgi:hypothetical protein
MLLSSSIWYFLILFFLAAWWIIYTYPHDYSLRLVYLGFYAILIYIFSGLAGFCSEGMFGTRYGALFAK